MTADVDDEALRWEGDADPSYVPTKPAVSATPAASVGEPANPVVEPATAVVEPATAVVEPVAPVVEPVTPVVEPVTPVVEPVETPAATPGTGSFLLVTYGILAGAYLIYTIGWLVPILSHERPENPDLLGEFMVRLAQVLAIAAPAIWYGASLLLTRGRRPIYRLLALLGGLVVLLPWPYLLLGV